LTGADLAGLGSLPTLVFFNACESARVRSPRKVKPETRSRRFRDNLESGVGLAEAFMRGGIANFVGTYWPVGDQPAEAFARVFYREILRGRTISAALQAGRNKIRDELESKDWANYIHYGSPDFVIKELESED
jgi:CHAT domain-containing protein